jgi:hypothetical protein
VGLGGFVASVRSGQLEGAYIEPGTPLDECLAALGQHLDADTLAALSRKATGVAKARTAAEPYSEEARDELVEWMAGEGWLNETLLLAHAVEKRAALTVAAKRLFGEVAEQSERGDDFVTAALHQAVSEQSTIPTSPEVQRHVLLELAKAVDTDPEAADELIAVFNRAEILVRAMLAEA